MARHVLVVLLVAVCVLQVVLSVPTRERRDAATSTFFPKHVIDGLGDLASHLVKETLQVLDADSVKELLTHASQFVNKATATLGTALDRAKTRSGS